MSTRIAIAASLFLALSATAWVGDDHTGESFLAAPSTLAQEGRVEYQIVLRRRFFQALVALPFGLGLIVLGAHRLYDKRRLSGATLVCVGLLLGESGITLLWLTRYSGTWNWWL